MNQVNIEGIYIKVFIYEGYFMAFFRVLMDLKIC
jgi:hypothetical protein